MKIDEIEIGTEYALPQNYSDPRRVKAVEVVTEEVPKWSSIKECYDGMKKVKKVKVKFLDKTKDRYTYAKGATQLVEARVLVPWSEVGPAIKERAENEARSNELRSQTEKRVKALLGRNYDGYVTVHGRRDANLDVRGRSLEKLLALAEAGKAKA